MSGGHWGFLYHELSEAADRAYDCISLIARFEDVLDYGITGDTCQQCSEGAVIEALKVYFGENGTKYDLSGAYEVLKHYRCNKCQPKEEVAIVNKGMCQQCNQKPWICAANYSGITDGVQYLCDPCRMDVHRQFLAGKGRSIK